MFAIRSANAAELYSFFSTAELDIHIRNFQKSIIALLDFLFRFFKNRRLFDRELLFPTRVIRVLNLLPGTMSEKLFSFPTFQQRHLQ